MPCIRFGGVRDARIEEKTSHRCESGSGEGREEGDMACERGGEGSVRRIREDNLVDKEGCRVDCCIRVSRCSTFDVVKQ